MARCNYCGGEITFRYIEGACTPIHLSGGCYLGSYTGTISFVDPNASCPVCGEQVFFYRSPFNGRVFFDELGPPWPKHPCTDNAGQWSPGAPLKTSASDTETSKRKAEWQRSGWKPFRCRKTEYDKDMGMTAAFGKVEGEEIREWTLFIGGEVRDLKEYPTLVKPRGEVKKGSNYRLATFRLKGMKSEIKELYLDAYLPAKYY